MVKSAARALCLAKWIVRLLVPFRCSFSWLHLSDFATNLVDAERLDNSVCSAHLLPLAVASLDFGDSGLEIGQVLFPNRLVN